MDLIRQTIIASAEVETGVNLSPSATSQRVRINRRRNMHHNRVGHIVEHSGSEARVRVCPGVSTWIPVGNLEFIGTDGGES